MGAYESSGATLNIGGFVNIQAKSAGTNQYSYVIAGYGAGPINAAGNINITNTSSSTGLVGGAGNIYLSAGTTLTSYTGSVNISNNSTGNGSGITIYAAISAATGITINNTNVGAIGVQSNAAGTLATTAGTISITSTSTGSGVYAVSLAGLITAPKVTITGTNSTAGGGGVSDTATITSAAGPVSITGISTTAMAVSDTALITGNSITVTGTGTTAATVVSLGAMTINACSAGVACNSNNISVTGNDTAAGGNTGITQTGAITQNANGGSIYFISNNQISQAGNISIAQNTSGIDSVISYNTTNGNKLSTINAGAVTFLGTSTSHINYNNIASGAPIIVNSALNVPGSITFDNTYLAGVQGGINASNAWQYGTTAANGIAITCATTLACGSLTANYGIYLRGVVGASSSSANQTFDAVSINAVAPLAITSSGTFAAGTDAINIVGITPQFVVTTNATPTSAVKGNAIGISGAVTITNNSTGGNTNIVAYQGRYSDAVTITNASTAGALELSAIGTTADIVTIAGTTFTQNSNAGVFIATSNNGNVTPPKIINNGTGPVVIEAGAYLAVGTVSSVCSAADCGQITALSGNNITSPNGNVYL